VNGQLGATIGAAFIALLGAFVGLRNGTRANRPAESNAQLAWVKQAQEEANEARAEAKEAKVESAAARNESDQTRRQQIELRRQMDAMQEWMDRVVRAAAAYRLDNPQWDAEADSGVIRILRAINGGPHYDTRQP
jgi:multidrug efflux pump subunit AcrB